MPDIGAGLTALILVFGLGSGAHFNPAAMLAVRPSGLPTVTERA